MPLPVGPSSRTCSPTPSSSADDDALDGRALLGRERLGLGLAGERLALGGRGPLAARRAAHRRDELERARGRRAVVVGDPEREVDERRRDLVEQPPDR